MHRLTPRQREFLRQFVELYTPGREPLHYTVVARQLGIGNVSAYEMLRLLEERGLVAAERQFREGVHGPGRPQVVFRPTPLGVRVQASANGAETSPEEWREVRTRLLNALQPGRPGGHAALLDELIARVPARRSVIVYAAEMVTAVLLGLEALARDVQARVLLDKLREMAKSADMRLGLFAGLGMGLSLAEGANQRLGGFLLAQSARFHDVVSGLNEENSRRLAEFAQQVLQLVAPRT